MDKFLANKVEELKCAIAVEEAIMAGLQPTMKEWEDRAEKGASSLLIRKVREWTNARDNLERFKKELGHFEELAKSTGAKAEIRGDQIVISVDIDALPLILSGGIAAGDLMSGYFYKVTDAAVFAKEVVSELNRENEIGTTPIHKMFDKAMMFAIEQGGEGVEEVTEDEFDKAMMFAIDQGGEGVEEVTAPASPSCRR